MYEKEPPLSEEALLLPKVVCKLSDAFNSVKTTDFEPVTLQD